MTTATHINLADLPLPGTDWPEQGGVMAGLLTDEKNRPYLLILGPENENELNWAAATQWAKDVEENGHRDYSLPTRVEQALLFARLSDRFEKDWYWSCEQPAENADYAWMQYFNNGSQGFNHKGLEWRVRAVRRLIIQ
jgi:hypothetical protein